MMVYSGVLTAVTLGVIPLFRCPHFYRFAGN